MKKVGPDLLMPSLIERSKVFLFIFIFLYVGVFVRHASFLLNFGMTLLADVAVYLLIPLFISIICYAYARNGFNELLAEARSRSHSGLLFALLGFVYANVSVFCVRWSEYLLNYHVDRSVDISLLFIVKFGFYGVLYLSITAALFEELLFKSILIRCFKGTPSKYIFITLSSISFVASHYWQGYVSMFVIAILFAVPTTIYYYRTRNILNLFVFHFAADFLMLGGVWARL